ncbi:DEAD/DEAH box helicase [Tianweitania populi]|uniref:DEAD/DEAH box helicase n=1 Tax=Tianweitania populi TaxID=1607949 RepID=A0A8J3GL80_9HYPH|nr:DEAD/DEAH box helicase [Tianweitania populi]GHD16963.1 DEAD/DEAH box helicase [Tianweitania populi]
MTDFPGVLAPLAQALTERGYSALTPVQDAVLALEPAGADALVSAQTGSGKTVAFGLALAPTLLEDAERFDEPSQPLALAIAPTRELALQVKRELEWLYAKTGAVVVSCVGGMDMRSERRALDRGCHIVVGTPGRLRDHITRHGLDMSELRAVVLDEADEMLDLGFREDLEFILGSAPADRRTLMFSATVSRPIAELAKSYQRDAVRLATTSERTQHVDIEYRALTVAQADRENAIINVLRYYEAPNALVFCSTRAAVNHLTARFNNRGFSVVAMSGELSQNERTHALQAMRDGRARVCIATDVAARGIDLPGLELVIHADTPTNRETLLHRSGRTGRAGRKGVSVLIVPQSGRKRVERLLSSANVQANWARPPSADEVLARDNERILQDPVFTEPLSEDETPFVTELLAKHGAEAIAAAYVRTFRAKNSAPEDLMEIAVTGAPVPSEKRVERRDEFGESIWISLSVGRKQNAEPRWLIPMLCKAGKLSKSDIGQIKLQQDESLVQLEAQAGNRFLQALGNRTLERGITARAIEGTPDFGAPSGGYDKPRGPKKPHRGQGPKPEGNWSKPAGKKPYAKKEGGFDKPWADKGPRKSKPFGDKPHAPGGKKSKRKPD